ncbi:hypothetical protein J2Z40_000993 [Cytobacillus eiseniae]|uniref:Cytosolic protein n=1 Tax=Cytobacillus eiseniae TaxID=762947 RepID=A0ABS4RC23_9BACI|nr:cytosolic protein [Cytobacillus eiseniae]MBP2240438.1 hypothetical protein [Cytobacillus eiseniae]
MARKDEEVYADFSNVIAQRNNLTAEELPEGAYGSPFNNEEPVENKSTPWRAGQRKYSAFTFTNKDLHEGLPRQMDGAHPPHDDPEESTQSPY